MSPPEQAGFQLRYAHCVGESAPAVAGSDDDTESYMSIRIFSAAVLVAGLWPAAFAHADRRAGERAQGLDARELFPFRAWSHEFVMVEGEDRGEVQTVRFTRDPDNPPTARRS